MKWPAKPLQHIGVSFESKPGTRSVDRSILGLVRILVFFPCMVWVLSAPGRGEGPAILDIRSGAAPAGAENRVLEITLTGAVGIDSIEFSLFFDPEIVLDPRILRGTDTLGWIFQNLVVEHPDYQEVRVTASTSISPIEEEQSEMALFIFDVFPLAIKGKSSPLILDNVNVPNGFEVHADLGTLVVGDQEPSEVDRELEIEFSESLVLPGDRIELLVYTSHVPLLTHLQIFLDYPESFLEPVGDIGGVLVEDLNWEGFFTTSRSILVTTFQSGDSETVPLGRHLLARVPVEIGENWESSNGKVTIDVTDVIALGDSTISNRFYNIVRKGAELSRPAPDFNGDQTLDRLDLLDFSRNWRGLLPTP